MYASCNKSSGSSLPCQSTPILRRARPSNRAWCSHKSRSAGINVTVRRLLTKLRNLGFIVMVGRVVHCGSGKLMFSGGLRRIGYGDEPD